MFDRLDTIFDTIRKSRVHRLVVIDENNRLKGVLTLSDILEYVLLEGEGARPPRKIHKTSTVNSGPSSPALISTAKFAGGAGNVCFRGNCFQEDMIRCNAIRARRRCI